MQRIKAFATFVLTIFMMVFFMHTSQAQESNLETSASQEALTVPQASLSASPVEIPGSVSCFDYYHFGSVQVDVESDVSSTVSGAPINFKATIKNDNTYPIVEGAVYAKIFKKQLDQDQIQSNGHDLVDQFFVQDGISLNEKENKEVNFQWNVPSYAISGDYQIAMFFTSAKKFNLLGLSFTDDVVGNTMNFAIKGEIAVNVEFNKNTVDINGTNYHFAAFPPRFKDEDIIIKADLTNFTEKPQTTEVTYKLYSWDGQTEDNLVDTKIETIQLSPKEIKQIQYIIQNQESPVYYLVIESKYKDAKSILGIRTVRQEQNKTRINFPAITSYPLKQNEQNTLFVCTHNSGTKDVIDNNKLILTILDENQKQIHQYKYEGPISGAMMGLKDDFTPKETYANFTIKTELYTDNNLVDQAEMKYDCSQINPDLCPKKDSPVGTIQDNSNLKIVAVIIIILILIISITVFAFKRKRSYTNVLMLGFMLSSMMFMGVRGVEAKSVLWSGNLPDLFDYYNGTWWDQLVDINLNVVYEGNLINVATGGVISDDSIVPVGTEIKFNYSMPNTNIFWFGYGSTQDSPYGYWKTGAVRPSDAEMCNPANGGIINDGLGSVACSLNPPTVNITQAGTAGMSCRGVNCTITSAGTVIANVNFAATYGHFYSLLSNTNCSEKHMFGCTSLLASCVGYTINIPTKTITYNLTAVAANNPPTTPMVSCPSTGVVGTSYDFTARAIDPDIDILRYGYDWDNDGQLDQYGTYVNSGVSQSNSHSWATSGSKTVNVIAQDIKGTYSTRWGSCTINILDKVDGVCGNANNGIFSAAPTTNLCATGIATTVTADTTLHQWKWDCSGSDGGLNSSCFATAPIPTLTFTASPTAINKGSSSTLSWETTNTSGCEGWSDDGTWNGIKSPTSSSSIVSPTQTMTYSMTCWNILDQGLIGAGSAVIVTVNQDCILPWGGTVPSGTNNVISQQQSGCGCVTRSSNCSDGKWSPESPYAVQNCSPIPAIEGICGSANNKAFINRPTTNLCSSGNATAVTEVNSKWVWDCNNICGTTSQSCSSGIARDLNWKEVSPN